MTSYGCRCFNPVAGAFAPAFLARMMVDVLRTQGRRKYILVGLTLASLRATPFVSQYINHFKFLFLSRAVFLSSKNKQLKGTGTKQW